MIGYYVHHHGAGHAQRFARVAALVPDLIGLGSGPPPAGIEPGRWVDLPFDTGGSAAPRDPTAGGALHWAPLGERGLTERTATIARWVQERRPAALVVDVSVEVALTARLLATPTVVVAQHGTRTDLPHELAFRSAAAVAALWPAGAAHDPPFSEGRLHHVGPISRFDGRDPEPRASGRHERRRVLVLLGSGGHELTAGELEAARAASASGWDWEVAGAAPELGGRARSGEELWHALGQADVVVAAASNNCIAEVAAARRPLIAFPQERPFDEQRSHAASLARLGLATSLDTWPPAERWGALLAETADAGERWSTYHDGRGAERFAALLAEVAGTT